MKAKSGAEQRTHQRNSLTLGARLKSEKLSQSVIIDDISVGGAKLKLSGGSPSLNAAASLEINTFGDLSCTVVWNRKNSLGISFTENEEKTGSMLYSIASYGAGAIA